MSDTKLMFNAGTKEQVALELLRMIRETNPIHSPDQILATYKKCADAVLDPYGS